MSKADAPTFLGFTRAQPGADMTADIALFGAPHGTPYVPGKPSHSAGAPAAIRAASARDAPRRHHYDFDWDGVLEDSDRLAIMDCGDVPGAPDTPDENRDAIMRMTASLLAVDAVPVMLGGDDSVPIPFVAAFEGRGPVWVLQVDAHLDWRDERDGERLGWSSTMCRISEMAHVNGIVQVGLRGLGSARAEDVEAAQAWGAHLIPASALHGGSVDEAISRVPEGADVIITFDCDGVDPSVMPGVLTRAPGGLTYSQAVSLIHGLGRRGRIVGFDLVELMPERDPEGLSALTAYRLVANAIAAIANARTGRSSR